MHLKPDAIYQQEETRLYKQFLSGEINLEELEKSLADLKIKLKHNDE